MKIEQREKSFPRTFLFLITSPLPKHTLAKLNLHHFDTEDFLDVPSCYKKSLSPACINWVLSFQQALPLFIISVEININLREVTNCKCK